jgi:AraC-like DNA-binding protein
MRLTLNEPFSSLTSVREVPPAVSREPSLTALVVAFMQGNLQRHFRIGTGAVQGDGFRRVQLQQRDFLLIDALPLHASVSLAAVTAVTSSQQCLLLACLDGELQLRLSDPAADSSQICLLSAGSILLLNPATTVRLSGSGDTRLLLVSIPLEEIRRSALDYGLHCSSSLLRFESRVLSGEAVSSLLQLLLDSFRCASNTLWLRALPYQQRVCDALILQNWRNNLSQPFRSRPLQAQALQKARRWLLDNLHDEVDIEQMAAAASVSSRTLYNLFRKEMSMTPAEFVRAVKIEIIHHLLSQNDGRSVTDIAIEYGFTNLGRFARQYRQQMGELPSATRKSRA